MKFPPNNEEVYIIAEAEINHNGNLSTALEMVKKAYEICADAIKFQYIIADEIAVTSSPYYELFKKVELSHDNFKKIFKLAQDIGIDCFLTVPSIGTLPKVLDLKPSIIKIGSTNLTNLPLLEEVGKAHLPVLLSTGLGTLGEIEEALKALNLPDNHVTLLHCTVQYPAPMPSLNLRAISTLKTAFSNNRIGFSDHTESELAAVAALTLGAQIFEKHFTLDKKQEGPDHCFSTDPTAFAKYIEAIRQINTALGDGIKRASSEEAPMIKSGRRYIVTSREIKKGSIIKHDDLLLRRIPKDLDGIEPKMLSRISGWEAPKNYKEGEPLSWNDFKKTN